MQVYVWYDDRVRNTHYDSVTSSVTVVAPKGTGAPVTTSSRVRVCLREQGTSAIESALMSMVRSGEGGMFLMDGDGPKSDFLQRTAVLQKMLDVASRVHGTVVTVQEVTHNDTGETVRDAFDTRTRHTPRPSSNVKFTARPLTPTTVDALVGEVTDIVSSVGHTKPYTSAIITIQPPSADAAINIVTTSGSVHAAWRPYAAKCIHSLRQHAASFSFHKTKITSLMRKAFAGQRGVWLALVATETSLHRDTGAVLHMANEVADLCDAVGDTRTTLSAPIQLRSVSQIGADADALLREALEASGKVGASVEGMAQRTGTASHFNTGNRAPPIPLAAAPNTPPDLTVHPMSELTSALRRLQQLETENERYREVVGFQSRELIAQRSSRAAADTSQVLDTPGKTKTNNRSRSAHGVAGHSTANDSEAPPQSSLLAVRHEYRLYREAMEGTLLRLRSEVVELKKKEVAADRQLSSKQKVLRSEQEEISNLNKELQNATKRVEMLESSRSRLQGEFYEELCKLKAKNTQLEQMNRELVVRLAQQETSASQLQEEFASRKRPAPTTDSFTQTNFVPEKRVCSVTMQTTETIMSMQAIEEQLQQVLMEAISREHHQKEELDASIKKEHNVRRSLELAQQELKQYHKEKMHASVQAVKLTGHAIVGTEDLDPFRDKYVAPTAFPKSRELSAAEKLVNWKNVLSILPPMVETQPVPTGSLDVTPMQMMRLATNDHQPQTKRGAAPPTASIQKDPLRNPKEETHSPLKQIKQSNTSNYIDKKMDLDGLVRASPQKKNEKDSSAAKRSAVSTKHLKASPNTQDRRRSSATSEKETPKDKKSDPARATYSGKQTATTSTPTTYNDDSDETDASPVSKNGAPEPLPFLNSTITPADLRLSDLVQPMVERTRREAFANIDQKVQQFRRSAASQDPN